MKRHIITQLEDAVRDSKQLESVFTENQLDAGFRSLMNASREALLQLVLIKPDGSRELQALANHGCLFSNLRSGSYELMLSTGRLLWSGQLSQSDLCIEPESHLQLAADTDEVASGDEITKLLNSELTLEVIKGVESGTLQVRKNHDG